MLQSCLYAALGRGRSRFRQPSSRTDNLNCSCFVVQYTGVIDGSTKRFPRSLREARGRRASGGRISYQRPEGRGIPRTVGFHARPWRRVGGWHGDGSAGRKGLFPPAYSRRALSGEDRCRLTPLQFSVDSDHFTSQDQDRSGGRSSVPEFRPRDRGRRGRLGACLWRPVSGDAFGLPTLYPCYEND
jgi:hypothetical protein